MDEQHITMQYIAIPYVVWRPPWKPSDAIQASVQELFACKLPASPIQKKAL